MSPAPAGVSNVPFRMLRENMDAFPIHELPEGYRFRKYREGDDAVWLDLHIAGEPFGKITPELFAKQFGDGLDLLSQRMFFVESEEGAPAGSITAWWEKTRDAPDGRGRIHWVIVHPEHRRQGIAKAMMTRAMVALRENYRWAMLETSSGRRVAVRMYLDFGFMPDAQELSDPAIFQAWQTLQSELDHASLGQFLREQTPQQNRC